MNHDRGDAALELRSIRVVEVWLIVLVQSFGRG